jgi:hypothetical protein
MEDNAPCIKIKFSQPEVSRKRGRRRLKWLDSVSKKYFGSELMLEKAGNRDLWSANIIDAKANKGLKHQTKEEDFKTESL